MVCTGSQMVVLKSHSFLSSRFWTANPVIQRKLQLKAEQCVKHHVGTCTDFPPENVNVMETLLPVKQTKRSRSFHWSESSVKFFWNSQTDMETTVRFTAFTLSQKKQLQKRSLWNTQRQSVSTRRAWNSAKKSQSMHWNWELFVCEATPLTTAADCPNC